MQLKEAFQLTLQQIKKLDLNFEFKLFSILILQSIDTNIHKLQAIVLSPTRELAEQTFNVMKAFGTHLKARIHARIGGSSLWFIIK